MRSLLLTSFATLTFATPKIALPFNSQVPLLARVNQAYNFALSPTTFTSDVGALAYTLSGAPAWLNVNAANGALSGTPGTGDAGTSHFTITAKDSTGSVDLPATLIISASTGPQLTEALSTQLAKAGNLTGPTTLAFAAGSTVSFSISPTIFDANGATLYYYSTLSDRSPLPAWLSFNNLQFSGTAPTNAIFPQRIDVLLMASEVKGFASIVAPFSIVISSHQLAFKNVENTFTFNTSQTVTVQGLRDQLELDGAAVPSDAITFATANTTDWLKFDSQALTLTGTPPAQSQDLTVNVLVAVTDKYGDIAKTLVRVRLTDSDSLFIGEIPSFNVTAGQPVNYTIDRSLFARSDVNVSVDLGSASKYLTFDAQSLEISGKVPTTVNLGVVHATLSLTTLDGAASQSESFSINVKSAAALTTSSSAPSSAPTAPVANNDPAQVTDGEQTSKLSPAAIAGIVLGVTLFVIFLIILLWLLRRRAQLRQESGRTPFLKQDISRPVTRDEDDGAHWQHNTREQHWDAEKGLGVSYINTSTPPRVDVNFDKKKSRTSFPFLSGIIRKSDPEIPAEGRARYKSVAEATLHGAADTPTMDEFSKNIWTGGVAEDHQSEAARRMARGSRSFEHPAYANRASRTRTRADSVNSYSSPSSVTRSSGRRSMGLPVHKRMTGLGHGISPNWARTSIMFVKSQNRSSDGSDGRDSYTNSARSIENGPPTPRHARDRSGVSSHKFQIHKTTEAARTISDNARPVPRRLVAGSPFFSAGPGSAGKRFNSNNNNNWSLGSNGQVKKHFGLDTIIASPDPNSEVADPHPGTMVPIGGHTRQKSSLGGPFKIPNFPSPARSVLLRRDTQKSGTTWRTINSNSGEHSGRSISSDVVNHSIRSGSRQGRAHSRAGSRAHSRSLSRRERWSQRLRMSRPVSELSRGTTSATSSILYGDVDLEEDDAISYSSLTGYESKVYSYTAGQARQVVLERSNPHLYGREQQDSPTRGYFGHFRWRSKDRGMGSGGSSAATTPQGPIKQLPSGRLVINKKPSADLNLKPLNLPTHVRGNSGNSTGRAQGGLASNIMSRTRASFRPKEQRTDPQASSKTSPIADKGDAWSTEMDDDEIDEDDEWEQDFKSIKSSKYSPPPLRISRLDREASAGPGAGADSSVVGNEAFI